MRVTIILTISYNPNSYISLHSIETTLAVAAGIFLGMQTRHTRDFGNSISVEDQNYEGNKIRPNRGFSQHAGHLVFLAN